MVQPSLTQTLPPHVSAVESVLKGFEQVLVFHGFSHALDRCIEEENSWN